MGAGAFLLSEYCSDFEHFFKQEEHLDWFRDEREMLIKVKHYHANDSICEQIAKKGSSLVNNKYSWGSIMQKILDIVVQQRCRDL